MRELKKSNCVILELTEEQCWNQTNGHGFCIKHNHRNHIPTKVTIRYEIGELKAHYRTKTNNKRK